MSIYFDFKVGPKGRMFRRAVEGDKSDIESIWNKEHTENLFYEADIRSLIELSALAICMINNKKEVIGFMALSDYPNIPGVYPGDWENCIRNMYQRYYLARNTLFVHFMCCIDSVKDFFVEEAFISVFYNDSYLQYILLTVPMTCPDELLSRYQTFKKRHILVFKPKTNGVGNLLYTALRADFCPKLKMRRAVYEPHTAKRCFKNIFIPKAVRTSFTVHIIFEEDNDDIVEILDKTTPRLKELYGAYYISEIIGRHPESNRKILVADIQGRAVAVICLNTDINYKKLQSLYELRPFYGLRTATNLEKEQNKRKNILLKDFGEPIMMGKWCPFHHNLPKEYVTKQTRLRHPRSVNKQSRVNFVRRQMASESEVLMKSYSGDWINPDYLVSRTPSALSVVNMLDEDPFDYDILNIDTALLTGGVPRDIVPDLAVTITQPSVLETTVLERQRLLQLKNSIRKEYFKKKAIAKMNAQKEKGDVFIYRGENNAFMIELFAFRHDIDERHALDLLEAAFELMKNYDYCIIRVPCADDSFPLLQHFCQVPTKKKVCCDYSLYVAHRSSVLGKLRVRDAEIIDIPHIARLLSNMEGDEILNTVRSLFNKSENLTYVFTSGMQIVGLGILESPEELDFIRGRFNLDSYQIHKYHTQGEGIDAGFASVKCIIMYPAFEPHFRFFARELMRLSGHSTLLWMTAYRNKWKIHKANCIVASMVPLIPRTVEIDSAAVPELKRIATLIDKITAFSCWFIGRKFTTMPKIEINTRIVVIGASRTATGFFNSLLFDQASSYLTFTNVTLISPYGLPYTRYSKPVSESMFLKSYISTDKYLKSVPYTYYINVVQGTMMELDLHEKIVTLTSGRKYHYDLLFLLFGKQYQHPDYMSHLLKRDFEYRNRSTPPPYIRLDQPRFSDTEIQISNDETPENVFIVNEIAEANKALDYVKKFVGDRNMKIVVYGATIHAYLCITALLEIKVHPENIVFVEPFPPEDPRKTKVPVFCNATVDETVTNILQSFNIKVYKAYYFKSWSVTEDNIITHVDFLSYGTHLQLECNAFFYYGKIGVNMRAFIAIHKSGLAYDGGIVIDRDCRTLNPYVYAAGPCTRYHKRYYADDFSHKYYDTYELGEKLGAQIRNQLDPLFYESKPRYGHKWTSDRRRDSSSSRVYFKRTPKSSSDFSTDSISHREIDSLPPQMHLINLKKPKVMNCLLPGGLKYLEVRSPGLKTPHHYVQSLHYNGFVYETFVGGYFKIHLTKDFIVDGVTCLSQANFSLENFKHIYGKPAAELNNMQLRYMANKLHDFFEFFRAPWAYFLYHDQSDDLFAMLNQLCPKGERKGFTLKEALCQVGCLTLARESQVFSMDNKCMQLNFEKSPHIEAVTDFLIDWLSQNEILLPMYWQPGTNVQYNYDLPINPLFTNIQKENSKKSSTTSLCPRRALCPDDP